MQSGFENLLKKVIKRLFHEFITATLTITIFIIASLVGIQFLIAYLFSANWMLVIFFPPLCVITVFCPGILLYHFIANLKKIGLPGIYNKMVEISKRGDKYNQNEDAEKHQQKDSY